MAVLSQLQLELWTLIAATVACRLHHYTFYCPVMSLPMHSSNHAYVQINQYSGRKTVCFFLSISLNIYFGCSKEASHLDGSFEYPQHMFWLKNKDFNF